LEKALKIRHDREEEAKIALGRAIGALDAIEQRLKTISGDRLRAAGERFAPGNGTAEILAYEQYIKRLDAAIEGLLKEAALAELRVEEARAKYIETSRDRKVLDKLRERRRREYVKVMRVEEAKALDDIAQGAAARELNG
jgi:flagellar FliJ protein